ncbi:Major facilitator transporter [Pseudomonas amygdali pv. tabaci]|uniref:Major facilitator transporter n=1 Tax=Pseudomonas amygdali pv. tabaci TaxID=322 RepID=A0A3M6HKI8_PSEAJ|nr:Major facilitator transporter [Pseudomonas amygdali pv. tabaci]
MAFHDATHRSGRAGPGCLQRRNDHRFTDRRRCVWLACQRLHLRPFRTPSDLAPVVGAVHCWRTGHGHRAFHSVHGRCALPAGYRGGWRLGYGAGVHCRNRRTASRRARLVSRNELMIVSGQLLAYVLSAVMAALLHTPGIWRYMLAIAMVPGVLLLVGTFFVPPSPRWLASKGRFDEAQDVLEQLRTNKQDAQREVDEMKAQDEEARHRPKARELLRQGWVIKLLLIGIGLGFTAQLTGVNAFMYYTPIILKNTGMGTNAALTATIGNGVVSVIATLLGIWAIGRYGRRHLLMTGLVMVILMQAALGCVLQFMPQNLTQSYTALACILVFLLFMQMCISPVYWLLMSELFPMQVRGLLTGTAVSMQWLFNASVAFTFPIAVDTIGNPTFFIFAAINVGSLIFVFLCLPETKGKSLEQIEKHLKKEL